MGGKGLGVHILLPRCSRMVREEGVEPYLRRFSGRPFEVIRNNARGLGVRLTRLLT